MTLFEGSHLIAKSLALQDQYMNKIVKNGITKGIVSHKDAGASYENVKKGFLFYLNASGRYLVLREHLRQAVSEMIQQKCVTTNPGGFKNQRNFQVNCILDYGKSQSFMNSQMTANNFRIFYTTCTSTWWKRCMKY